MGEQLCKKCLDRPVRLVNGEGRALSWKIPKGTNPDASRTGNFTRPRIPARDGMCRQCFRSSEAEKEEAMRRERSRLICESVAMEMSLREIYASSNSINGRGSFGPGVTARSLSAGILQPEEHGMNQGDLPNREEVARGEKKVLGLDYGRLTMVPVSRGRR